MYPMSNYPFIYDVIIIIFLSIFDIQIQSAEGNTSQEIWIENLIMEKVRRKIPKKLEVPKSKN